LKNYRINQFLQKAEQYNTSKRSGGRRPKQRKYTKRKIMKSGRK